MSCSSSPSYLNLYSRSDYVNKLNEKNTTNTQGSIKDIPFGNFSDKIVGYCSTTFSPMYRRIFSKYWNNAMVANVRKNYCFSDFEEGIVEIYIPTFLDPSRNMKFHRIVVKTLPYLDHKIMEEETVKLRSKRYVSEGRGPAGIVDSESIVLMARHISPEALVEYRKDKKRNYYGLKPERKWFLKAKKLRGNILIMPIITKVPEIAMKRLLTVLKKFYHARIKAFVESFHLMNFQYDRHNLQSSLYYISSILEERVSFVLGNAVRCLSTVYDWFDNKRRQIIQHLSRQTYIMNLFHQIEQIKPLLGEIRRGSNPFKLDVDPELVTQLLTLVQPH